MNQHYDRMINFINAMTMHGEMRDALHDSLDALINPRFETSEETMYPEHELFGKLHDQEPVGTKVTTRMDIGRTRHESSIVINGWLMASPKGRDRALEWAHEETRRQVLKRLTEELS